MIKIIRKCNQDIGNYLEKNQNILNDDKFWLNDDIKNKNKIAINKVYTSFINNKDEIMKDAKKLLTLDNLQKDNEEIIRKIYESKNDEYKKDIKYEKFYKKVEKNIYKNIINNSEVFINNIMNACISNYIIKLIKEGIREQFKEKEEIILSEIYKNLFKNQ